MIARPAFLILGMAVFASANAAQPSPQFDYHYNRNDADRAMDEFARCVVSHRSLRAEADRYLRAIPVGEAFHKAAVHLATPDCVPRSFGQVQMRFQGDLLRAALFGALYQRDFGRSPPPADLKAAPALALAAEFDGPEAEVPPTIVYMRTLGDCTARADAADVHVLVVSKVASNDEKEALAKVVPQLALCVSEGHRLAFSRPVLRGLLAEALYKLRHAAAATNVQSGAH